MLTITLIADKTPASRDRYLSFTGFEVFESANSEPKE